MAIINIINIHPEAISIIADSGNQFCKESVYFFYVYYGKGLEGMTTGIAGVIIVLFGIRPGFGSQVLFENFTTPKF